MFRLLLGRIEYHGPAHETDALQPLPPPPPPPTQRRLHLIFEVHQTRRSLHRHLHHRLIGDTPTGDRQCARPILLVLHPPHQPAPSCCKSMETTQEFLVFSSTADQRQHMQTLPLEESHRLNHLTPHCFHAQKIADSFLRTSSPRQTHPRQDVSP